MASYKTGRVSKELESNVLRNSKAFFRYGGFQRKRKAGICLEIKKEIHIQEDIKNVLGLL